MTQYRVFLPHEPDEGFGSYICTDGTKGPFANRRLFDSAKEAVLTAHMLGFNRFTVIGEGDGERNEYRHGGAGPQGWL